MKEECSIPADHEAQTLNVLEVQRRGVLDRAASVGGLEVGPGNGDNHRRFVVFELTAGEFVLPADGSLLATVVRGGKQRILEVEGPRLGVGASDDHLDAVISREVEVEVASGTLAGKAGTAKGLDVEVAEDGGNVGIVFLDNEVRLRLEWDGQQDSQWVQRVCA